MLVCILFLLTFSRRIYNKKLNVKSLKKAKIEKCWKQGLYLKAVWSFWRLSAEREGSSPPITISSAAAALSASCTDYKGYPLTLHLVILPVLYSSEM
jgi:hypothetical protein